MVPTKVAYAALIAGLAPSSASACAVCFGKADKSGIALGLSWGILVLLSATLLGIIGIVSALLKIEAAREAQEAKPS